MARRRITARKPGKRLWNVNIVLFVLASAVWILLSAHKKFALTMGIITVIGMMVNLAAGQHSGLRRVAFPMVFMWFTLLLVTLGFDLWGKVIGLVG